MAGGDAVLVRPGGIGRCRYEVMRCGSGRRKGRHGAARGGVRAQLGVQGTRHRAVPAEWGGARPLERASRRGAASGDGG
jgi:hypothetical protein